MNCRMIALDLDDTLLHSDRNISEYTLSVLRQCRERGILIAIATARSVQASARFIQAIQPDIVISNGGALAEVKDQIITTHVISEKTTDSIIQELINREGFVSLSVETSQGNFVTWEQSNSPDYSYSTHYDFTEHLSQAAYKITAEFAFQTDLLPLTVRYPECALVPFSHGAWYRLAHKNATKFNSIKQVARHLNIDVADTIAFGDDYSDVGMIQGCGIGVAMANAIPEVKAVADHICDTNNNDGVAKYLAVMLQGHK